MPCPQPENILLTSGEVCKIADLGEAQDEGSIEPVAEYASFLLRHRPLQACARTKSRLHEDDNSL